MAKKATVRRTRKKPSALAPRSEDVTRDLNVDDALRLASLDPTFGNQLLNHPDKFRAAFNLSREEVAKLKDAGARFGAEAGHTYE